MKIILALATLLAAVTAQTVLNHALGICESHATPEICVQNIDGPYDCIWDTHDNKCRKNEPGDVAGNECENLYGENCDANDACVWIVDEGEGECAEKLDMDGIIGAGTSTGTSGTTDTSGTGTSTGTSGTTDTSGTGTSTGTSGTVFVECGNYYTQETCVANTMCSWILDEGEGECEEAGDIEPEDVYNTGTVSSGTSGTSGTTGTGISGVVYYECGDLYDQTSCTNNAGCVWIVDEGEGECEEGYGVSGSTSTGTGTTGTTDTSGTGTSTGTSGTTVNYGACEDRLPDDCASLTNCMFVEGECEEVEGPSTLKSTHVRQQTSEVTGWQLAAFGFLFFFLGFGITVCASSFCEKKRPTFDDEAFYVAHPDLPMDNTPIRLV